MRLGPRTQEFAQEKKHFVIRILSLQHKFAEPCVGVTRCNKIPLVKNYTTLKTPHPEKVIFIVIVISIIIINIIINYYYDCFISSQPHFSMSAETSCTNVVFNTEFKKIFIYNPELLELLEFVAI